MTQSSAALEISDEESKAKSFNRPDVKDDRGKENIDPNEILSTSTPVLEPVSSVVVSEEPIEAMDTQEPRTPLGDLNASTFYGEGLNATSVVLVHDDEPETEAEAEASVENEPELEPCKPARSDVLALPTDDFTFEAPRQLSPSAEDVVEFVPEWAQRTTLVFDESPQEQRNTSLPDLQTEDSIDVWESESARDENEQRLHDEDDQGHCIVVGEGETITLSSPCLNEL